MSDLRMHAVPVRRRGVVLATALAGAAALATPAVASAGSGGAAYLATPKVQTLTCVGDCPSGGGAYAKSRLRLRGKNLEPVTRVIFTGAAGRGDDVPARVSRRSSRLVEVRVPARARSGPLVVIAADRVRSAPTKRLAILVKPPPPPPAPQAELTPVPGPRQPDGPRVETATDRVKLFLGSAGGVSFSYRVSDAEPVDVEVQVRRAKDGAVVRSWRPPPAQPGVINKIAWDGTADGRAQREGRYQFRLVARGKGGATAESAQAADTVRDAFDVHGHMFPVAGRHDFGGAGARFGTGRAGHSHQGQDIFAACGVPLVAARGGVVKFRQYHAAAGHYLVIDGEGSSIDYAYMHMTEASRFGPGQTVKTGEVIGTVGESGNARGCHLHFELWSAPGWYDGGRPFDPYPALRAWDRVS